MNEYQYFTNNHIVENAINFLSNDITKKTYQQLQRQLTAYYNHHFFLIENKNIIIYI